jgi:hypothetical protein
MVSYALHKSQLVLSLCIQPAKRDFTTSDGKAIPIARGPVSFVGHLHVEPRVIIPYSTHRKRSTCRRQLRVWMADGVGEMRKGGVHKTSTACKLEVGR